MTRASVPAWAGRLVRRPGHASHPTAATSKAQQNRPERVCCSTVSTLETSPSDCRTAAASKAGAPARAAAAVSVWRAAAHAVERCASNGGRLEQGKTIKHGQGARPDLCLWRAASRRAAPPAPRRLPLLLSSFPAPRRSPAASGRRPATPSPRHTPATAPTPLPAAEGAATAAAFAGRACPCGPLFRGGMQEMEKERRRSGREEERKRKGKEGQRGRRPNCVRRIALRDRKADTCRWLLSTAAVARVFGRRVSRVRARAAAGRPRRRLWAVT